MEYSWIDHMVGLTSSYQFNLLVQCLQDLVIRHLRVGLSIKISLNFSFFLPTSTFFNLLFGMTKAQKKMLFGINEDISIFWGMKSLIPLNSPAYLQSSEDISIFWGMKSLVPLQAIPLHTSNRPTRIGNCVIVLSLVY